MSNTLLPEHAGPQSPRGNAGGLPVASEALPSQSQTRLEFLWQPLALTGP